MRPASFLRTGDAAASTMGRAVKIRRVFVWLHRWTGLAMAGFLILVGVTGSLLAFLPELNRLITPQLFASERPGVAPLDLAALAEHAERLAPDWWVDDVSYSDRGQAMAHMIPRAGPVNAPGFQFGFAQLFLDPWTGNELGRRRPGEISQGWIDVMPFIYRLHDMLAMGPAGAWILGVVALVWTLDCFVGFYLTLPTADAKFWRRWKPAWLVKANASVYRVNFDLHRAGGLWLWAMLLIFAWSSVYFNLPSVYKPVSRLLLDFSPQLEMHAPAMKPRSNGPALGWRDALTIAEKLMAEQARKHNFVVERPAGLHFNRVAGTYLYRVRSSRDVDNRYAYTRLILDAYTGAFKDLRLPTGEYSGDTVSFWLSTLHMGHVFGLPYRIFVCVLGLVITMLSVTGVYIWWKKRRARQFSKAHRGSVVEAARTDEAVTG